MAAMSTTNPQSTQPTRVIDEEDPLDAYMKAITQQPNAIVAQKSSSLPSTALKDTRFDDDDDDIEDDGDDDIYTYLESKMMEKNKR